VLELRITRNLLLHSSVSERDRSANRGRAVLFVFKEGGMEEEVHFAVHRDPNVLAVMRFIHESDGLVTTEMVGRGIAGLSLSDSLAALNRGQRWKVIDKVTVRAGADGVKCPPDHWILDGFGPGMITEWIESL
jgi:hypothetical protein